VDSSASATLLLLGDLADQRLRDAGQVELHVAGGPGKRGVTSRRGQDHHVEIVAGAAQRLQGAGQREQRLLPLRAGALQAGLVLGDREPLADLVGGVSPGAVQQATGDLLDQEEAEHGDHDNADDERGRDHPELQ
jgi:hypothetical protein